MAENNDLVKIEQQIAERKSEPKPLTPATAPTAFSKVVDEAKVRVVTEAAASDPKFVKEFKDKLQEASLKAAQVEKEKQALEEQLVKYHQELLETQQKLNAATQQVNEWEKKQKRRQYHFDGVKPIMHFVGIKEPMNLLLLYFLTIILTPFYLLSKLLAGTIGALVAGAADADRPKAVRGFLWTILAVAVVIVLAFGVLWVLTEYGIIEMPKEVLAQCLPTLLNF